MKNLKLLTISLIALSLTSLVANEKIEGVRLMKSNSLITKKPVVIVKIQKDSYKNDVFINEIKKVSKELRKKEAVQREVIEENKVFANEINKVSDELKRKGNNKLTAAYIPETKIFIIKKNVLPVKKDNFVKYIPTQIKNKFNSEKLSILKKLNSIEDCYLEATDYTSSLKCDLMIENIYWSTKR